MLRRLWRRLWRGGPTGSACLCPHGARGSCCSRGPTGLLLPLLITCCCPWLLRSTLAAGCLGCLACEHALLALLQGSARKQLLLQQHYLLPSRHALQVRVASHLRRIRLRQHTAPKRVLEHALGEQAAWARQQPAFFGVCSFLAALPFLLASSLHYRQ